MFGLEIIVLIITYTILIITIFLEIICYKRNLETLETILFTGSLMILILALTTSSIFSRTNLLFNGDVFIHFAMILVGVTTPLNVLSERKHKVNPIWKKVLLIFSAFLLVLLGLSLFFGAFYFIQDTISIFLLLSIVLSMLMITTTPPLQRIAHQEKTERIFAYAFIILVPLSFFVSFLFQAEHDFQLIGFTIPIIFILLAGNKLWDDIKRLSLVDLNNKSEKDNFKNYPLTKREHEIAQLLIRGKTYKVIAKELFISMPTVKTHTSNIYKKCQVKSRAELMILIA